MHQGNLFGFADSQGSERSDIRDTTIDAYVTPGFQQAVAQVTPSGWQKALGAYYTDSQVADFLVWWAIHSPTDTVLDPSFGGGVFLRSACKRLIGMGAQIENQVYGVEIDGAVHTRISEKLHDEFGVRFRNLLKGDFFEIDDRVLDNVTAIVGNPPFIRYQRFSGEARGRALRRAAEHGVRLNELVSSWAPFLVHSVGNLARGGRLAMVIPFEITHAAYARPLFQYLAESFAQVIFLTFRKKLFPDLSEETLLLLAEGKGSNGAKVYWRDIAHAGVLGEFVRGERSLLAGVHKVDAEALAAGRKRLIESFIPKKAGELYRELAEESRVKRMGELAYVGIGYVTGANDFFHLDLKTARLWKVPPAFLRPAVRRGRALRGLRFTRCDWESALEAGDASYLLHIESAEGLPESLRAYLSFGEKNGVSKTYKCRSRTPWFRVPHVYQADAFLTYMSGVVPQLVANEAGVVSPNTLHIVRLHGDTGLPCDVLAALWQTSLTRLSAEIEGHALGGGMLKLEPTEAERVLIATPDSSLANLVSLSEELNLLLRKGEHDAAIQRADAIALTQIGLSHSDCRLLRESAQRLRERRYSRGKVS